MNKSLEYIKNRVLNSQNTNNMPTKGWEEDKVSIINPIDEYLRIFPQIKQIMTNNEFQTCILNKNNKSEKIKVTIQYDNNIEYDYFTSNVITHDGTLMFIGEGIQELLNKLLTLQTYCQSKVTQDFLQNPWNYDVKYIIGDIIIHYDYGMKNINGVNMSGVTNIIMIPIKFVATTKNLNKER